MRVTPPRSDSDTDNGTTPVITAPAVVSASTPLVAVIIPALNEAGKIGRVLDKMPRDGRFEATPDPMKCRWCEYTATCTARVG